MVKKCEEVFKEAKKFLIPAPVLAHFNASLPVSLTRDASPYRIGAVNSKRNYAHVEKEALALAFGIKKFHT